MMGTGTMYPMLSAWLMPCIATPTTLSLTIAGPPLFPGFSAASICTARKLHELCV